MKKLFKAKQKIGALSKNAKNPFFKSAYLDLAQLLTEIEPILFEEGLMLLQPIKDGVVWSIIVDGTSGEEVASSGMQLPEIVDPQKLGSCVTYYRRYTLKSLLSIAEIDDDGNHASKVDYTAKLKGATNLDELTKVWNTIPNDQRTSYKKLAGEMRASYERG